jgi:hypothetical protein
MEALLWPVRWRLKHFEAAHDSLGAATVSRSFPSPRFKVNTTPPWTSYCTNARAVLVACRVVPELPRPFLSWCFEFPLHAPQHPSALHDCPGSDCSASRCAGAYCRNELRTIYHRIAAECDHTETRKPRNRTNNLSRAIPVYICASWAARTPQ